MIILRKLTKIRKKKGSPNAKFFQQRIMRLFWVILVAIFSRTEQGSVSPSAVLPGVQSGTSVTPQQSRREKMFVLKRDGAYIPSLDSDQGVQ